MSTESSNKPSQTHGQATPDVFPDIRSGYTKIAVPQTSKHEAPAPPPPQPKK